MKITDYIKLYNKRDLTKLDNIITPAIGVNHKFPKKSRLTPNKEYSVNDALLIGITGAYGKTSTVLLLQYYFESLGYRVVSFGSAGIHCPNFDIPQDEESESIYVSTKANLALFLFAAQQYQAEIIIFEVHADNVNLFKELNFSCKILTSLSSTAYDIHMGKEKYFAAKIDFFTTNPTLSVLDAYAAYLPDIITGISDLTKIKLFKPYCRVGHNVEEQTENFEVLLKDKAITRRNIICDATLQVPTADKSWNEFVIKDKTYLFESTLGQKQCRNIISCAAILTVLNEFNDIAFNKIFGINSNCVPGRSEDFEWNGRTIIIDYNSLGSVLPLIKNTNRYQQAYYDLYGKYYNLNNINKVKMLFSLVGTNIYTLERRGLFPVIGEYTLDEMHNYHIFAVNLYKLLYDKNPTETFPDADITDIVVSNNGHFSESFLNTIASDLEYTFITLNSGQPLPGPYWGHIDALLAYFGNAEDIYAQIYEYFKSFNYAPLSKACNMILEHIDKVNKANEQQTRWLNKLLDNYSDIFEKVYLSTKMSAQGYQEFLIKEALSHIHRDAEGFPYRKDAIKAILEESKPGDLLLINGRGNAKDYTKLNETERWTDREYIEEVIKELDKK